MRLRYVMSGTIDLPDGSDVHQSMANWFKIHGKKGNGIISVAPTFLYQSISDDGTSKTEPVDFTLNQAEDCFDVKVSLGDKSVVEVSASKLSLANFKIGDKFKFVGMDVENQVTDIGTRVLTYIRLDQIDERNYNGPPYSIVEHVLDEYEIEGIEKL